MVDLRRHLRQVAHAKVAFRQSANLFKRKISAFNQFNRINYKSIRELAEMSSTVLVAAAIIRALKDCNELFAGPLSPLHDVGILT